MPLVMLPLSLVYAKSFKNAIPRCTKVRRLINVVGLAENLYEMDRNKTGPLAS